MFGLIIAIFGSYIIGSIPSGLILVRVLRGKDVRELGSGNIGATNVIRTAGRQIGFVVFALDVGKGWIASTLICSLLVTDPTTSLRLLCGFAASLGHTAPVFLRFQGGKGVATTIGALLGAAPALSGMFVLIWGVVVFMCKYVSVGSMVAACAIPIAQILIHSPLSEIVWGALLALLIVLRHKTNIGRLLQGREPRIVASKR